MITIIILISIALLISLFANKNLLTKVESYEDIIHEQEIYIDLLDSYITKFKSKVKDTNEQLTALDAKGSFEADDEVGFVFKEIKEIFLDLDKLNKETN